MISDCGHKYISAFKPSQQVTGEWWFFPDKLYNSTINPFPFPLLYFWFAFIDHFLFDDTKIVFVTIARKRLLISGCQCYAMLNRMFICYNID